MEYVLCDMSDHSLANRADISYHSGWYRKKADPFYAVLLKYYGADYAKLKSKNYKEITRLRVQHYLL